MSAAEEIISDLEDLQRLTEEQVSILEHELKDADMCDELARLWATFLHLPLIIGLFHPTFPILFNILLHTITNAIMLTYNNNKIFF